MNRSRVAGILVGAAGVGLLSWLLVDATSVASTLQLPRLMDEAGVVVLGLAAVGACFVGAFTLMRPAPANR